MGIVDMYKPNFFLPDIAEGFNEGVPGSQGPSSGNFPGHIPSFAVDPAGFVPSFRYVYQLILCMSKNQCEILLFDLSAST